MHEAIVDTNILLRVITNDNERLSAQAAALLGKYKEGQIILETAVFYEAAYILTSKSFYNLPRRVVADALRSLLNTALFDCDESLLRNVLDLLGTTELDFVDCLLVAQIRLGRAKAVLTQDKDLLAELGRSV